VNTSATRIERLAGALLALACAGALVALILRAPVLQPDSAGYIAHSPERGVVYPAILDVLRYFFGDGYLAWTARIQGLGIGAAAFYFVQGVGARLGLGANWRMMLFALLTLPSLYFSSQILAEPLAYAGLMCYWALLLEDFYAPHTRRSLGLCVLCVFLWLLRPQLVYLLVFHGLWRAGLWLGQRSRANLLQLGALVLALVLGAQLQGAVRQAWTGNAKAVPPVGAHMLSTLLYISAPEDAALFVDPVQREIFTEALGQAEANGRTLRQWDTTACHYTNSLTWMYTNVVRPLCNAAAQRELGAPGAEAVARGDRLALVMALRLALAHPVNYGKLMARKLYDAQPMFALLSVCLAVLGLAHAHRTGQREGVFYALVTVQLCLCYALFLPLGGMERRYTFLAESFQVVWAVALGAGMIARSASQARR
jgi:hypothetical protein